MQHESKLTSADARLVVVTSDPPHHLRAAVAAKGLGVDFASVDPSLWSAWGLANPKRPDLPHPASIVIRDRRVLFRQVHVDYRQRTDPVDVISALSGTVTIVSGPPIQTAAEPAWGTAVQLHTAATATGGELRIDIADGFHVYGTRESQAIPIVVTGAVAELPPGEKTKLGKNMGVAWVLSGSVVVPVTGTAPLQGDLVLQVCTSSSCSPPRTLPWSITP